ARTRVTGNSATDAASLAELPPWMLLEIKCNTRSGQNYCLGVRRQLDCAAETLSRKHESLPGHQIRTLGQGSTAKRRGVLHNGDCRAGLHVDAGPTRPKMAQ